MFSGVEGIVQDIICCRSRVARLEPEPTLDHGIYGQHLHLTGGAWHQPALGVGVDIDQAGGVALGFGAQFEDAIDIFTDIDGDLQ